jgi:hypothetical protein
MSEKPRKASSLLRFGLRTMLVLTTIAALLPGYLAFKIAEGRRHEKIAAALKKEGGWVDYTHYELVPVQTTAQALAGITGQEYQYQSTLPDYIESTPLAHAIRRINRVVINAADEEGQKRAVETMQGLKRVNNLSIYTVGFEGKQIEKMLDKTRVNTLFIQGAKLPRTRIGFLNHEGLTWLCVARTQFSDPAIADLPESLTYFDATRTRISDEGLDGFLRLRNLKKLILRRTPTTPEAIARLRDQMPNCKITWEKLKRD